MSCNNCNVSYELINDMIASPDKYKDNNTETLLCPALQDIHINGVDEGCRNEVAFRLAQHVSMPYDFHIECPKTKRSMQWTFEFRDVLCILEEWNTHNRPPLPERELLICVKQGFKTPCSYGSFGQGMFTKYPLKAFCDKHKDKCVVRKILKKCNAHGEE